MTWSEIRPPTGDADGCVLSDTLTQHVITAFSSRNPGTGSSPCGAGDTRKEDTAGGMFRVAAEREVYPLVQYWQEPTGCIREAEGVEVHGDPGEVNPRANGVDHQDRHLAFNGPPTPSECVLSHQSSRENPRGRPTAVRTGQPRAVSPPNEKTPEELSEGTPRRETLLRRRAPLAEGQGDGKLGVRRRRDTTSEGDRNGNRAAIGSRGRACGGGDAAAEVTSRRKRQRAQEVAARGGDQERRVREERTASVLRVG